MGRYEKKIAILSNNQDPRLCPGCQTICFLRCTGECTSSCIGTLNMKPRSEDPVRK